MATIREMRTRGGVRYQVQVRLRGFPPQVATFDRKTDARDWAQETESAIRQGRHLRPVEAKRHTVAEMIDRYCGEVLEPRHGGDVRKRSSQLVWWKAKLGPYTLGQVTPAMIAELRERLRRGAGLSGKPAGPATQVRYLASLSHVFSPQRRLLSRDERRHPGRDRRDPRPSHPADGQALLPPVAAAHRRRRGQDERGHLRPALSWPEGSSASQSP